MELDLMKLLMNSFSGVSQGMMWVILALGVYITFRILDFPDMSCEGSFALGGSISAVLVANHNWNPYLSMIISIVAGMIAGLITGILHTKLKIPAILSGILTMVGLYSVNLVIMGQANTSLLGKSTMISIAKKLFPDAKEVGIRESTMQTWVVMAVGLVFTAIVVIFLYWFFGTEIGSCIRATGNNKAMVRAQGVNTDNMIILGLALSNGLIAMSGALVTNSQGYADISMGIGAIVIGLASIVIGEVIFFKAKSFVFKLIAIGVGSLFYRVFVAVVLWLGLDTNYFRLLNAMIVVIALSIPTIFKGRVKVRKEVK